MHLHIYAATLLRYRESSKSLRVSVREHPSLLLSLHPLAFSTTSIFRLYNPRITLVQVSRSLRIYRYKSCYLKKIRIAVRSLVRKCKTEKAIVRIRRQRRAPSTAIAFCYKRVVAKGLTNNLQNTRAHCFGRARCVVNASA